MGGRGGGARPGVAMSPAAKDILARWANLPWMPGRSIPTPQSDEGKIYRAVAQNLADRDAASSDFTSLADVRKRSGLTRERFDLAAQRLADRNVATLAAQEGGAAFRTAEHESAGIVIGGRNRVLISIGRR